MNRWLRIVLPLLLLPGFSCAVRLERPSALPAQTVLRIADAVPNVASTQPARPRKLLIFTRYSGAYHESIPWAAKALEIMGTKTGSYKPVVSDDLAMFEPDTLRQFDGVFLVHTTRAVFMPKPSEFAALTPSEKEAAHKRDERLKKSLVDFVRNGGGLAGLHAAADSFYEWDGFREILGAFYDGHPWNDPNQIATLTVEEPDHPLSAAFGGSSEFRVGDEIYQFKEPYSREQVRVLLSVNLAKTQTTRPYTRKNMRRSDNDYAVAWIRRYGSGRVFYCSLGHSKQIYLNRTVLRFYLDGIQYILGDLVADARPAAAPGALERRIAAAIPKRARVEPKRPRKLLIFSYAAEGAHKSIPWGKMAFERMGEATGAYEAVVSDDPAMLRAENLKQFDAVLFNNANADPFQQAQGGGSLDDLLDLVRGGKGFIAIHSASHCASNRPEFGRLIGARPEGEPWWLGKHRWKNGDLEDTPPVSLRPEEPDHPLAAMFGGRNLSIREEIYVFGEPYSRDRLRVLLTLDWDKTARQWGEMHKVVEPRSKRVDRDFAVSWIQPYGSGRVFYCELGHASETYANPTVLQHYLAGIQFALGDLEADATPSAKAAGRD